MNLIYDAPFLKGLSFKGVASYSHNNVMDKTLTKTYMLYNYVEGEDNPYTGTKKNDPSNLNNSYLNIDKLNLQAMAIFSREFARAHKVDATLIYEYDKYGDRTAWLSRDYDFYTIDQMDYAGEDNQKNGGMEDDRLTSSLVGRLNYGYRDKYLLEFAFRYEGSYRYHPDIRWQFFPVVSAGWRVSEENFMKNIGWLSNLKLRASYGISGSDLGSPHQYVDGYALGSGGGYAFTEGTWTNGIGMPALLNKTLTWVTSKTADVGIDIGLFRNKIAIEADLFQRDNTGLLGRRNLSLPNTFGATLPEENLNHSRNQGFDISLAYNDRIGEFYFGIKGNFTMTRTKWIYYERGEFGNSYDRWRNGVNNRWSDFTWGYELEGQFGNDIGKLFAPVQGGANGNTLILPGDYKYKDVNGDGVINDLDMVPMFYSGNPTLQYGLTLNGSWKGLDFSVLLQGSSKYTVRFREVYAEVLAFELNTPAYFFDRWHREDPYNPDSAWIPGKWPSTRTVTYAGSNYLESEIWRKDASYIRLKNVDIGYTFPRKWFEGSGVESLRVYFNGQNLLTICDPFVRPFDPEKIEGANSSGFTYPVMRSFNFGVNINF
jgi:TonB-linked SusC/RagA family outer membrane protein